MKTEKGQCGSTRERPHLQKNQPQMASKVRIFASLEETKLPAGLSLEATMVVKAEQWKWSFNLLFTVVAGY